METWKDVLGYNGIYQISNLGNVKSINRKIVRKNGLNQTFKTRILKPIKKANGYLSVALAFKGKIQIFNIHRLVAIHFVEGQSEKFDVNHIDSNKENNLHTNLEWVSRRENHTHYLKTVSSKLIGSVYYKNKKSKKWAAKIKVGGVSIFLGYFDTEIEAHNTYINYLNNNSLKNKYSNGIKR